MLHQQCCVSEGAGSFNSLGGRGGVLAFIFSMFMFLDKRSCVNQTASFCRAGFWVWFGLVSLVPLLGSSGVCLITMHDDSCSRPLVLAIFTPPRKVEHDFGTTHRFLRRGHHDKTA